MGILISRFRRKKSTKEQLEAIEKQIKSIHEFRIHTEQRQKRFVGALIAYSVVLYIFASLAFYFYYLPEETSLRIVYGLPLFFFPFVVYFMKEFIRWYYQRKLQNNDTKLTELLRQKRKILDEVMETETYLVARELLEKYDPDQLRKKSQEKEDVLQQTPGMELRRRPVGVTVGKTSPIPQTPRIQGAVLPQPYGFPGSMQRSIPPNIQGLRPPGPPMARPILPRDRNVLDRLVEYLVGDGPSTRYALICRQCQSHNGMALKEEFEFIAFRCCYCFYWNPARKQRSTAPRLPEQQPIVPHPPSGADDATDSQNRPDDSPISNSSGGDESESAKGTDEDGEMDDEKDAQGDIGMQNQRVCVEATKEQSKSFGGASTDSSASAEPEHQLETETEAAGSSETGSVLPEAKAESVGDC